MIVNDLRNTTIATTAAIKQHLVSNSKNVLNRTKTTQTNNSDVTLNHCCIQFDMWIQI